jgi:hypothetical protein
MGDWRLPGIDIQVVLPIVDLKSQRIYGGDPKVSGGGP